jgi:hypothetical protein
VTAASETGCGPSRRRPAEAVPSRWLRSPCAVERWQCERHCASGASDAFSPEERSADHLIAAAAENSKLEAGGDLPLRGALRTQTGRATLRANALSVG